MKTVEIILDSTMLQSGDVRPMYCEQTRRFEIAYFTHTIKPTLHSVKSMRRNHNLHHSYRINAEIAYYKKGVSVLDFGIRAYQSRPLPPTSTVGTFVAADVHFGIYYTYHLSNQHNIMPLVYTWTIKSITLETAPRIKVRTTWGQDIWVTDRTRFSHRNGMETSAQDCGDDPSDDDGGTSSTYILKCRLLNDSPTLSYKRPDQGSPL